MKDFYSETSSLSNANLESHEQRRNHIIHRMVMLQRADNQGNISPLEKKLIRLQLNRFSSSEEIIVIIPDIHVAFQMEGLPTSLEEIELIAQEYIELINKQSSYTNNSLLNSENSNAKAVAGAFLLALFGIGFIVADLFGKQVLNVN